MKYLISTFIGLALSTTTAFAQEAASIDTGDTAWMLIATALVMLMTPAGLALFYGGFQTTKSGFLRHQSLVTLPLIGQLSPCLPNKRQAVSPFLRDTRKRRGSVG